MASMARAWVTPRERDDGAFDRLFLAEWGRVVGIAQRVLADQHAAEDVAQEVFYSFYRKHTADAPYAAAWLHRAAAHAALNAVRTDRRRSRREAAEAVQHERLHAGDQAALDPQRAAEEAEQRRDLAAALGRLPEKSAAVLLLRHSGLSYSEVAAALGVHVGQIGTLLRRGEAALRKEMTRETH